MRRLKRLANGRRTILNMQTRIPTASAGALALTVGRKELSEALGLFRASGAPIIEKRNTIPILSCVLLSVSPDKLTLSGTNLDCQLTIEVPAAGDSTGAVAIAIEPLRAAVKAAKGESVRLATMNNTATLTSDSGVARLPTLPAADFPHIVEGEPIERFPLDPAAFAHDLNRVAVAISTEETRYYLDGIFFHCYRVASPLDRTPEHDAAVDQLAGLRDAERRHIDADRDERDDPETVEAREARMAELSAIMGAAEAIRCAPDSLRMVSTDGHRLHYVTRPLADIPGAESIPDVILPSKAVHWIRKAGLKGAGSCSIGFSASKCVFQAGRMRFVTKLIDGTFPDYNRVIPDSQYGWAYNRMTVDADVLKAAALASVAHADERTRATTISVGDGWANAVCTSPDNGTNAAMIEGLEFQPREPDDASYVCGFNARYLADTMAAFAGERVALAMQDAGTPCRIEPADGAGEFGAVLMPMRVGGEAWTPERLARLDFDAVATFEHDAPAAVEKLARIEASEATHIDYQAKRFAVRDAKVALAKLVSPAIDLTAARNGGDRYAARLEILGQVAFLRSSVDMEAAKAAAIAEAEAERAEAMAPHVMDNPVPAGPIYMSEADQARADVVASGEPETEPDVPAEPEPVDIPEPEPEAQPDVAPMPAQPDEPVQEEPQADEPATGAPMFRSLQDFKAAAGVGSRWELSYWSPDTGWNGHRVVTVASAKARHVTFRAEQGAMLPIDFPKRGEWTSDAGGLTTLYQTGEARLRIVPLPDEAAVSPAAAVPGELEALRGAVEALEARLAAIEVRGAANSIPNVGDTGRARACGYLDGRAGRARDPSAFNAGSEPAYVLGHGEGEALARGEAPSAPVGRQPRTAAHERAVRRAWAERKAARLARGYIATYTGIIETGIADERAVRVLLGRAQRRIARLVAVLAGRKAQLATLGRELLVSRNRAADMRAAGESPVIAAVDSSPVEAAQPIPVGLRGRVAAGGARPMQRRGDRYVIAN
jgi:DNA polymerase III subunit beta